MAKRKNLTDANVSDLPIEEKNYERWDTKLPGLCVRVQPTGRKTFYFVYSIRGRTRWFRIGPAAIGANAARMEAKKLLGEVARGGDPQAERKAKRGGLTFEQLHKRYVEEWATDRNKSWKATERLVRNNVYKAWAKLPAASITRSEVKRLVGSIAAKQTANLLRAALSAVFTWGVEEAEVLTLNPCRGIRDNESTSRERVLASEDVKPFWAGCEDVDPVRAAALRVILLTGARPGEVSHMRYEHIKGEWWELPGLPVPELKWPGTKNACSHRVYLAPAVRELIGTGDAGFVFANTRSVAIDGLDAAMRSISEVQKLAPAVRPHDLRRSFGSMVTGRGHGREAMDRLLNHRKKSVTDVYDRFDYAEKDKAITADVAAAFMRLVEGQQQQTNVMVMQRLQA